LAAARDHDRVRRDVLRHRPREEELLPRRLGGVAADAVLRGEWVAVGVALLYEQPAEHASEVALARDEGAALPVEQHARLLLRGELGERGLRSGPHAE